MAATVSSRAGVVRVVAIALVSGSLVLLVDRAEAFWLCVPAVLLACVLTHSRPAAAVAAATVMLTALAAALVAPGASSLSPVLALLVPVLSAGIVIALRERMAREREVLRRFALHDPLTGIGNRRLLMARAEYEIARHARTRRSFALVMLDLDGFKLLNDRFGHEAGDELLRELAASLSHAIRAQDTVARIGGDEFCILAPETDHAGTSPLAARIKAAVDGTTAGVETLRASLGIAVFPHDGNSSGALLHAADLRLMAAKRERPRNRVYRRAA